MTILHRVDCPKCGWPSHADQRGRMMCCPKVRENEVHEDIKVKARRCKKRKEKTEHSGAGNERGGGALLNLPAGQGELFETGEMK